MWESRGETAKFYSAAWTSSSINPAASRLLRRAGQQLPGTAPAGSRSRFSPLRAASPWPGAQPACRAENKRERTCATAAGEGEREKKRSVTWRLFSLSARALLGAVVPEEGAAGASPGRAGAGNRAHVSPRELLSFTTKHSLVIKHRPQIGAGFWLWFFVLFSSTH